MNEKVQKLNEELTARRIAYHAARDKKRDVQDEVERAVRAVVSSEINRIYGPALKHLGEEYQAATAAYEAAVTEAALSGEGAPTPVGTVYQEWTPPRRHYFSTPSMSDLQWTKTGKTAVLEAVTNATRFPQNLASYSLPKLGTFILRHNKQDGTPGKTFDHINRIGTQWWAKGEAPKGKEEV